MTEKTNIELVDQQETASNGVQSHQPDYKPYSATSNASKRSSPTSDEARSSPTPDQAKKNNVAFHEGEAQKSYHKNSYSYF